jgi:polyhydroxyalkanoate synthesis repressor PhaR
MPARGLSRKILHCKKYLFKRVAQILIKYKIRLYTYDLISQSYLNIIFVFCKNCSILILKEKFMPEKVVLKKYANRRLYDTEKRAFVSLSQVAELVKQGREIEISDDKTGEDVTAFILTQIVLEEAKKKTLLLPVSLLYLLIRYGDSALSEFFENYLEQTLKNYLAYKSAMDAQFQSWLEMGQDFSNLTQKTANNLAPFQSWMQFFPGKVGRKKRDEGEEER